MYQENSQCVALCLLLKRFWQATFFVCKVALMNNKVLLNHTLTLGLCPITTTLSYYCFDVRDAAKLIVLCDKRYKTLFLQE